VALKGALEDNVLTMFCWDKENAGAIHAAVPPKLFSTRSYRRIAEAAAQYFETYGQPPRAHLRDILEADLMRGEEGLLLQKVLSDMEELLPELQPKYVLAELDKFVALRHINSALEAAADAAQHGDIEAARAAMFSAPTTQEGSRRIWLHKPDESLSFFTEREEDYFSSGIDELDRRGIRPKRRTVFMIVAPKKTGKSWWLIEIAKRNIFLRHKILHISLEMEAEEVSKRYVQAMYALTVEALSTIRTVLFKKDALGRCTSLDFHVRTPDQLKPENRDELAAKLSMLSRRPPILIVDYPTAMFTVSMLNSLLDELERKEGFKPDIVMIDYPKLMKHDPNNLRISLGRGLEELRGVAKLRNAAFVLPAQGNRSAGTAKVVTSEMLGEDYSMAQTADIICTLSRTPAERDIGLARVFVDAARTAEDKLLVMIAQSLATGQFCLDSAYMSKHVEAEINRVLGEDEPGGEE